MSKTPDTEHLLEMVPFYVNETLAGADKQAFEDSLQSSPKLRDEVASERALQQQFNAAMVAELGPQNGPPIDLDKPQGLMNRPTGDGASSNFDAKPNSLMSAMSFLNPLNWKPAVTLALAAAAVGQAAFIGSQADTINTQGTQIASLEKRNFELASGKGDCGGDATIILEPAGNAAWSDLNDLISEEGLTITGGGFGGPLMLKHDEGSDNLEEILGRLNASPLVGSAMEAS